MFVHETELDVRYYETDMMGIVHHSNYIRYFECGRNDALISVGLPIWKIEEMGVMTPVIRVECNYKHSARNGERLKIVTMIKEPPMAKIIIYNEIFNAQGQLLCNGSVPLGFINSVTRKAIRAPHFFLDKFSKYFDKQ